MLSGLATFPLCFSHDVALQFNDFMVTTAVPDQEDLETMLEIGSWTWGWMEPPLGQLSFFLLTLQFARAQMENMGAKPFTHWRLGQRSGSVVSSFPQYNKRVVYDFAFSAQTA